MVGQHDETYMKVMNKGRLRKRGVRIKDPVFHIGVGLVGRVSGLGPGILHLFDQAVLVLLDNFLAVLALSAEPLLQLVGVPTVVRLNYIGVPVVLDEILKVLAVCWSRIWHIVV